MAKVKSPLWSIDASGKFGGNVRYSRARGQNRAVRNRTGNAVQGIGQRRQASIMSEAGRIWKTVAGKGPEQNYQAYIGVLSKESFYFMSDDILLEWDDETIMVAE